MKKRLVLLIICCLIANPLVSLFAFEQKANTTSDDVLKSKCDTFASLCTLINLSVNSSMAQTFPLSQDKSKKTKDAKQDQNTKLYCASSASNLFPMWKVCEDLTSLVFSKCKVTDLGLTKFYPEKWRSILIFLIFTGMLCLLPRGAIDNSAMPVYKVKKP